ncbi:MAG: glycoside hydrolase family 127 protein [Acidobacteria bacterium]|nr:glycoside hydrolase family 127 protein [Acidobacteriota bacterium]
MTMDRREFINGIACVGASAALETVLQDSPPMQAAIGTAGPPAFEGRMAFTPATAFRPYVSKMAQQATENTWVQIDLGSAVTVEGIRLYPAFNLGSRHANGYGFPVRFKVEGAEEARFAAPRLMVDQTSNDLENPEDRMILYSVPGTRARYVRLTATKLGPMPDGAGYCLALSKVDVISGEKDVAEGTPVSVDSALGNEKDRTQLTRPSRSMGEGIITDNPGNVTAASSWHPVTYQAMAPLSGVTVDGGLFKKVMENNIGYLLSAFSVPEMLRPFRQRAGKPVPPGLRRPLNFWDVDLPGSSAGRFLMGAGNTLRWMEHAELRRWMNELVDGIEECRAPNGYIMAYPENEMFYSERAGYTRAWLTHGLIEAGYAGIPKAFDLLRGYYDWFNGCPCLREIMRGTAQGVQGMIANTRIYFTPVGKPEDLQVVQRYFQENYWLEGLAARDKSNIWQYPYDRPHNYLITDFEAYLDLYRATGDERYLRAMQGAWELYRENWEHVGGSTAITEFGEFPPKSYRLNAQVPFCETGELCGSVFWSRLNQRFHLLYPEREEYVTEIEKSIYNVGIAAQVDTRGLLYHARLVGQKGDVLVGINDNSCCEGQGTRLLGSLPEYIYSIASDGLYINMFQASTIRWPQDGQTIVLKMATDFPFHPEVQLTLGLNQPMQCKIRIRVPYWAKREMKIAVNGRTAASGKPESYVTLDRVWNNADVIAFTLPMDFTLTRYEGLDKIPDHERFALEYGPVLLAVDGSADARLVVESGSRPQDILKQIKPKFGKPLQYDVAGASPQLFRPYWEVQGGPFTCFPVIDTHP